MTDTSEVVPAIKGDRTGGPWVELWGDWLYQKYALEHALVLPLGDVGSVYHVHRSHLWGEPLPSSGVRLPGLLLVIAM